MIAGSLLERILDNKGTTFRFTGPQTQALIGTYRELKGGGIDHFRTVS